MDLKIISSSSAGNAYILENDQEALLIECGVRFDHIKKALKFNLKKVVGCLLTHEHGDHAKSVKDVMASGIDVWATAGTFIALKEGNSHRARITYSGDQFKVGNFTVKAFDVQHDVAEPVGFIINHSETGNILFITDSYYCGYNFRGMALHNIIIEANYCKKIIDAKVVAGTNPKFLRDRVITSHMSIDTCKELLKANDLSAVNNIVLIHLSEGNSNAKQFQEEITAATGKKVHVARPGMIIENFHKRPF